MSIPQRLQPCILASIIFLGSLSAANAQAPHHVPIASLPQDSRELFQDAMKMADGAWDPTTNFLRVVGSDEHTRSAGRQMVRETSWYALGLLMRDQPGDRARAATALESVLKQQYLDPNVKWYGTFRRSPEEHDPPPAAVMWLHYDPNWRVFIGTTFELILLEYPERLPPGLSQKLLQSIDLALQGEMHEGRLVPAYTNIALMYGALLDFAGTHDKRADWTRDAAAWDDSVFKLFKRHNAFDEYNSPTYYGTDLYGLAIWRLYGSSSHIRSMGKEMEDRMWRDIADYYQPNLRNLAGPYDRSYGMDMESYVALVGVWMRSFMSAAKAPLPAIAPGVDHVADAWFAPPVVLLGASVPKDTLSRLQTFAGPHLVKRQITDQRSATTWIGESVIFGGEATSGTKAANASSQFHPATVQWRTPSGEIGWVRLFHIPPVEAVADPHSLSISATGDAVIRIHARNAESTTILRDRWRLPGMTVIVDTDAKTFTLQTQGDLIELTYTGITHMKWTPTP